MGLNGPGPARALARLALAAGLGVPNLAAAEPYTPPDDQALVATVPQRSPAERAALGRAPAGLDEALARAREALARAQVSGDPRELGQAQAALGRWWALEDPGPAVRLLRASIRQSLHDFDGALRDLDALLAQAGPPEALAAQARLSRAGVLQVLGRWEAARTDCERLARSGPGAWAWAAQVCVAELASLQGQPGTAAQTLARLAPQAPPDQQAWLTLVRAELAERRGEPEAGRLFAQAALASPSAYALGAWADWLLYQHRELEVLARLAGWDEHDGLLLRRAIALQRLGHPEAGAARSMLHERFEAARARGEDLHLRERARAALDLDADPATALALARRQWALQKEPADARLLSRAAHAAGQASLALETDTLLRRWRDETREARR